MSAPRFRDEQFIFHHFYFPINPENLNHELELRTQCPTWNQGARKILFFQHIPIVYSQ